MYFGDFERLIRRHQAPNASLHCAINPNYPNTVAIYDGHLPMRKKALKTQWGAAHDWEVQSFICNCHWRNGEIDADGYDGVYDYQNSCWTKPMYRGWKATLLLLLAKGAIRPSSELDKLIGEDTRKAAANHVRIYYEG